MRRLLRQWLGIEEIAALSGAYLELTKQHLEVAAKLDYYEQYVESIRYAKERRERLKLISLNGSR